MSAAAPLPQAARAAAATADAGATERARLRKAAQGFEAIFVRQMLASARQTSFAADNPLSGGDDTFRQMRDERFAEIAAQSGAFGFARQIEAALGARLAPPASGTAKKD